MPGSCVSSPRKRQPTSAAERDREHLGGRRGPGEHEDRRPDRERESLPVGSQRPRHAPDGVRDDRDRDDLEPVQPVLVREVAGTPREQDERDGGGEREADPGEDAPQVAGPDPADADPRLARGRPGEELAEGDEVGEASIGKPAPPLDVLVVEIPEVRDRPAERRQPQSGRRCEHLEGACRAVDHRRRSLVGAGQVDTVQWDRYQAFTKRSPRRNPRGVEGRVLSR